MFHAHVSAKDIPLYQVFLAGALACRFQRSEAAMRNSLIWNLQGDNVVNGTTLPTTPTSWSIVGIGSFGGNGQNDNSLSQCQRPELDLGGAERSARWWVQPAADADLVECRRRGGFHGQRHRRHAALGFAALPLQRVVRVIRWSAA